MSGRSLPGLTDYLNQLTELGFTGIYRQIAVHYRQYSGDFFYIGVLPRFFDVTHLTTLDIVVWVWFQRLCHLRQRHFGLMLDRASLLIVTKRTPPT